MMAYGAGIEVWLAPLSAQAKARQTGWGTLAPRDLLLAPVFGAVAQLGERLPCTQEVSGSIPLGSTITDSVGD